MRECMLYYVCCVCMLRMLHVLDMSRVRCNYAWSVMYVFLYVLYVRM